MARNPPFLPFRLEYTITRVYPWRWYTEIIFGGSILFLIIITLVNVAATGYETITVFSPDYNYTQTFWWSVFNMDRNTSICDPKDILIGDTFFTDTSAFLYTVAGAGYATVNGSHGNVTQDLAGWPYSSNSLADECLAQTPGPSVSVIANLEQKSVIGTIDLICVHGPRDGSSQSYIYRLSSRFTNDKFAATDDGDQQALQQSGTVGYTLRKTVYLLSRDILTALQGQDTSNSSSVRFIKATARPWCPGTTNWDAVQWLGHSYSEKCQSEPLKLGGSSQTALFVNGSEASSTAINNPNPNFLSKPLNQSVENFLLALASATYLDIGATFPGSLFVGQGMLNQTITSAPDVTAILSNATIADLVGDRQPISYAEMLRIGANDPLYRDRVGVVELPIPEDLRVQKTATIKTLYTCHAKRQKDALSLIISVLVADMSIFGAAWGTVALIASMIAKKRGDISANACSVYDTDSHAYALHPRTSQSTNGDGEPSSETSARPLEKA
ncbi:hypothetical protein DL96DRAFT_1203035 [Flagelloscypha sp. PMI_526]|nr:hypothetical protein DL96DRAFT_1203035 [Flagelloscypha sp. PMI_526]